MYYKKNLSFNDSNTQSGLRPWGWYKEERIIAEDIQKYNGGFWFKWIYMDLHLYMSALITLGFIIPYSRLASSSVAFHSAPLQVEPAPGIPSSPFPARHHLPEGSPHMLSFSFPNRLVERRAYWHRQRLIEAVFSSIWLSSIVAFIYPADEKDFRLNPHRFFDKKNSARIASTLPGNPS